MSLSGDMGTAPSAAGSRPHFVKSEPGKGNKGQCHSGSGSYRNRPIVKQPKFEGQCEELKGHIYDCTDARQADMFTKTTKEVAEYAGHTLKHSADIRKVIEELEIPTLVAPVDPAGMAPMRTETRIWEKKVDEYV